MNCKYYLSRLVAYLLLVVSACASVSPAAATVAQAPDLDAKITSAVSAPPVTGVKDASIIDWPAAAQASAFASDPLLEILNRELSPRQFVLARDPLLEMLNRESSTKQFVLARDPLLEMLNRESSTKQLILARDPLLEMLNQGSSDRQLGSARDPLLEMLNQGSSMSTTRR